MSVWARAARDEGLAAPAIPLVMEPTMPRTAPSLAAATILALAWGALPCDAQTPYLYDGYSHDPGRIVTYIRIRFSRADARTRRAPACSCSGSRRRPRRCVAAGRRL